MSNDDNIPPIDEEQLKQIAAQLESEEQASRESTLESVESLELWMIQHPGLQKMVTVDSFAQIGPAILQFLRSMMGF